MRIPGNSFFQVGSDDFLEKDKHLALAHPLADVFLDHLVNGHDTRQRLRNLDPRKALLLVLIFHQHREIQAQV